MAEADPFILLRPGEQVILYSGNGCVAEGRVNTSVYSEEGQVRVRIEILQLNFKLEGPNHVR